MGDSQCPRPYDWHRLSRSEMEVSEYCGVQLAMRVRLLHQATKRLRDYPPHASGQLRCLEPGQPRRSTATTTQHCAVRRSRSRSQDACRRALTGAERAANQTFSDHGQASLHQARLPPDSRGLDWGRFRADPGRTAGASSPRRHSTPAA
jgi:hypothetical protein